MKKRIVKIALVLGIILVVGLVAAFLSLNHLVKTGVETVGPLITKTEVKLEGANLSPFSGRGELRGLFVGNPEGFKTPSAISVKGIKVNLKVKSVFSDVVHVESVEIDSPQVTFEGRIGGSNLKKLLENISAVAASDDSREASKKQPTEGGKKIKVDLITIKNARVNLSVTGMGGKAASVGLAEIQLKNVGIDENGVSTAELSRLVTSELLDAVLKAVPESVGKVGDQIKGIGETIGVGKSGEAETEGKGLKKLFKR